ncbi:5-formyltetrahydrofolate cyclo-ligase [Humibacillus sp. DSM 29435]|uniref:5-formyltetrahydrofolate cyclo-ligase n=1 Tax=Humibacillus sp. DSM 29435 TaxID=1869167 RepID=UPI0008727E49|nr:5-formyltetrahydrofolate cyclo-ligase [Humibacillus sp. DSM 29435]OFE15016.1 5-formyltetrahydrofolate cyclo-ligase [Humibacillus sp. DSM 29435]
MQSLGAKRDLRHAARARRRAISAALSDEQVAAAGEAIADAVLGLAGRLSGPVRVAAYESLPDEPPTGLLIERLLAAGHEVIVPVTLADFSLQWRRAVAGTVANQSTVTRGSSAAGAGRDAGQQWLGEDALSSAALVITPGLTVDRRGTRLGQGGGCYDRALGHRDPSTPVLTLLHEGEASEVDLPRDEHDRPVDGWVSTTGTVVTVKGWPGGPADAG